MALDLKIELFAYDLFQQLFHFSGFHRAKSKVSLLYDEECDRDPDYEEVFDPVHINPIECRLVLFLRVYKEETDRTLKKVLSFELDFYECFLSVCEETNLFVGLTIFERVFATCTFLYQMCLLCYYNGFENCIEFAYLCWAMYFDKYSEEFYNEGGWQQLKRVATSYVLPWKFIYTNKEYDASDSVYINKISRAVKNYSDFMKSTRFTSDTYAKHWARYHVQNYNKTDGPAFDRIELNYSSVEEIEELLRNIRLCCYSCLLDLQQADDSLQLKQELPCKDNSETLPNPAVEEHDASSTERCSDENDNSNRCTTDAADSILVRDSLSIQDVKKTRSRQENVAIEPESSLGTVEKLDGSPIDLPVCTKDVGSKQNTPSEDKGALSLVSHIDIVTKYRSVSAILACKQESTETSEVHLSSCSRQSPDLGEVNIGPITEDILETSTLELSPCSMWEKMTNLDDETRESQNKQQEETKMQILADLTLDQKEEMFPATDSIKCIDRLDPPALFREITKSFDMHLANTELSSQLQPRGSPSTRFDAKDSILEECSKNITDEEDCENNFIQLGDECTEVTMEDLPGLKVSESAAGTSSVSQSASTSQDVVLSKPEGAAKKKKKRRNAKSKKQNPQAEQESDDVVDLLRMFLVLGDQVGVRHVCSTLQSSDKTRSVFTLNIPK